MANVNSKLQVGSKSTRTHFLLGGVNVTVSWWSSGYDTSQIVRDLGLIPC